MSIYRIEVQLEGLFNLKTSKKDKTWVPLCPTNGQPYEYNTRAQAERVREQCYPDHMDSTRVVEVIA